MNPAEIQQLLNDIASHKTEFCLICGCKSVSRVCVKCEGINEARRVYFYAFSEINKLKEKMKYTPEILEKIIHRKLEEYRSMVTCANLSCYDEAEKKQYFEAYNNEIRMLDDSPYYFNFVYKINDSKVKYNPTFSYDYSRMENIQKYCAKCTSYPCRKTRDENFNVGIIKVCSESNIGITKGESND